MSTKKGTNDELGAPRRGRRLRSILAIPILVLIGVPVLLLVLLALPFFLVAQAVDWVVRARLTARFRSEFFSRGIVGVLVYSNSPNWHDHIEAEVLPRIAGRLAIVNWSDRSTWTRSSPLPIKLFLRFKPADDFNPMGLVLAPTGGFESVLLRPGYLAQKHGDGAPLAGALSRLYALVDAAGSHDATTGVIHGTD